MGMFASNKYTKYLNIEEATWKAEYRCINDLFYSKRLFFVEFIKWISS